MSADKRRKILIGFAGLAVILVVVITYVSPTFRNESASSGAIAPVQKHRAPQIAQSDVVLGNEQVKQEQQIVFGDHLADATELRSISALGLKNGLENVSRRLDAHRASVEAKYAGSMAEAIGAAAALGRKAGVEQLENEVASLEAMLAQKKFDTEAMSRMNQKFQGLVSRLESADAAASYESAQRELNQAASLFEQKSALDAQKALEKASSRLEAVSSLGLRWRLGHLDALAAENKALEAASSRLSLANADEFAATLGKAADDLQAKGLDNMSRFASASRDAEAALNSMSATIDKMSRLAENRSTVDAMSLAVAKRSSELQARQAFEAQARQEAMSALENRNAALASAMR